MNGSLINPTLKRWGFFMHQYCGRLIVLVREGGEPANQKGWDGGGHNEDKIANVAHRLLHHAANHTGEHHAQTHERGAEGIVSGGVFARCELLHQINHKAH